MRIIAIVLTCIVLSGCAGAGCFDIHGGLSDCPSWTPNNWGW